MATQAEDVVLPGEKEAQAGGAEKGTNEGLDEAKAKFNELLQKQRADASDVEPKAAKPKAAKAPKEKKSEAEPEKPDPETERLRQKLLLAGQPKKIIESLSGDDVREVWKTQEERELSYAKALERASVAEKKLQALNGTTDETEERQVKGVPTSDSDLEEIAKELADQFGESEAGILKKALYQLTEPLRTRVNQLEGVLRAVQDKGVEDISAKNRQRLSQKYAHLEANDRAWQTIQKEVLSAFEADPSRYKTPEEAFDDIAEGLFGGIEAARTNGNGAHDSPEEVAETATLKSRIAASAPSVSERKGKPRPATPLDAARASFDILREDPEDVIAAARAWRRAAQTS